MNADLEVQECLLNGKWANTSTRQTPNIIIQCNSVVQVISSLWDYFACNLKGKAAIPADISSLCTTVDASGVLTEYIEKFLALQKNNRHFPLNR